MHSIIVSDLDGTLLNPDHRVSERTKQAIHNLLATGKRFIIATGRHHVDVEAIRESIGAEIYLITSNGARVHNAQGELVYSQDIAPSIAQAISEISVPESVQTNIFQNDDWFVNKDNPALLEFSQDSTFVYEVADVTQIEKKGIAKIFFCGPHDELLVIADQLKSQYGKEVNISFSLPMCLEVMDISVNKAQAIKAVLDIKGFTFTDTVAFGDGMNDIEMLSAVDKGLVMDNASDMLKSALPDHEVIHSSAEDGVARYIEANFL